MANGFSAATSLLLSRDWTARSSGPIGEMWGKGVARTPVPFDLEPGTAPWRQFLANIAAVEGVPVESLDDTVVSLMQVTRIRRRKQERAEMDLHLRGGSVRGHETSARDFGRFVSSVSACVSELVVAQFKPRVYEPRLQIAGVKAGSVRAQFREPVFDGKTDWALFREIGDTPESAAMLSLAQILNTSEEAAQSPADDDRLDALLGSSVRVLKALGELSNQVYRAGWSVDGRLHGYAEPIEVSISPAGAWRLKSATTRTDIRTRKARMLGVLDSWSWSQARMTLQRDGERPLRIAVPLELSSRVAELIRVKEQPVDIQVQVFEREAVNMTLTGRSYSLLAIDPVPALLDSQTD